MPFLKALNLSFDFYFVIFKSKLYFLDCYLFNFNIFVEIKSIL